MKFRDDFSYFSLKPYVVTPHLNHQCSHKHNVVTPHLNLLETDPMRGHNICLYAELTKIISNYHQILTLI